MKRVGIFAGSFDPIHLGHLAFAKQALGEGKLDKVFFLVEPRPRRKQGVRALEHRAQMVQLAVVDEKRLGNILLKQTQFNVTETLPILKEMFKGAELHLLLGDDVLNHLADWPHIEELIGSVNFVIGVRHDRTDEVETRLKSLERTRGLKLNRSLFSAPSPEFSSSRIRLKLKRGEGTEGLSSEVLNYIRENKLYESDTNS